MTDNELMIRYKEVHSSMKNRYANNSDDIQQAKDLQTFLSTVKRLGRSEQPGYGLENSVAAQIWNKAQTLAKKKGKRTLFNSTNEKSSKKQGTAFEEDIKNLILAFLPDKLVKEAEKHIAIGTKHVKSEQDVVLDLEDSTHKSIVEAMRDLRPDLKTYMDKNQRYIKIRSTEGKIDIAGPNITMNFDIDFENSEMKKYYDLLSNATFTAKSYASVGTSWNKHIGQFTRDLNADFPNLHLGKTDPLKATLSSLMSVGIPFEDGLQLFFNAYWSLRYKNSTSDEVSKHIWHLRFAYELTGGGSAYSDKTLSALNKFGARFLIYNDPMSDFISVTSTGELVRQILESSFSGDNPFTDGIGVAKTHLKNISNAYYD